MLEGQEITVIGFGSHTHLTGREIYTSMVKNGTEIGYLAKNKYYDFEFQNFIYLDPFIKIRDVNYFEIHLD